MPWTTWLVNLSDCKSHRLPQWGRVRVSSTRTKIMKWDWTFPSLNAAGLRSRLLELLRHHHSICDAAKAWLPPASHLNIRANFGWQPLQLWSCSTNDLCIFVHEETPHFGLGAISIEGGGWRWVAGREVLDQLNVRVAEVQHQAQQHDPPVRGPHGDGASVLRNLEVCGFAMHQQGALKRCAVTVQYWQGIHRALSETQSILQLKGKHATPVYRQYMQHDSMITSSLIKFVCYILLVTRAQSKKTFLIKKFQAIASWIPELIYSIRFLKQMCNAGDQKVQSSKCFGGPSKPGTSYQGKYKVKST